MHIDESIWNYWKITEKEGGYAYKNTRISATGCPELI